MLVLFHLSQSEGERDRIAFPIAWTRLFMRFSCCILPRKRTIAIPGDKGLSDFSINVGLLH